MVRIFICSIIVTALLPAVVHAEEVPRTTLKISPAITEWLVTPGERKRQNVLVKNTTKRPLPVSSLVRPFQLQGADKLDAAAAARYDVSAWLSIPDGDFILRPEESRKVAIVLEAPKNASPGGHYATAYFRQLRPVGSTGAEAQVGALTFITVTGDVVKKLEGRHVVARWSGDTLNITVTLRNTGNVHMMPEGEFVVRNWMGEEVGRVSLPQGMTMPQTVRSYHAAFKARGFGAYTVEPMLSYGGGRMLELPVVTAWTIPWKAMVVGMAAVAVGWFGIYRIRGRWKQAFFALTRRNH